MIIYFLKREGGLKNKKGESREEEIREKGKGGGIEGRGREKEGG